MQNLQQLPGVYAEPIPPEGSRVVGQLPSGQILFEREVVEHIGKEQVVINGVEQWKKHPTTGEPITPVMKNRFQTRTQRFVLHRGRNACNTIVEVVPPSPEETAHMERLRAINETKERLAEALVDNGVSIDALIGALKADDKPARGKKGDA